MRVGGAWGKGGSEVEGEGAELPLATLEGPHVGIEAKKEPRGFLIED
jgi:hypothetical protein